MTSIFNASRAFSPAPEASLNPGGTSNPPGGALLNCLLKEAVHAWFSPFDDSDSVRTCEGGKGCSLLNEQFGDGDTYNENSLSHIDDARNTPTYTKHQHEHSSHDVSSKFHYLLSSLPPLECLDPYLYPLPLNHFKEEPSLHDQGLGIVNARLGLFKSFTERVGRPSYRNPSAPEVSSVKAVDSFEQKLNGGICGSNANEDKTESGAEVFSRPASLKDHKEDALSCIDKPETKVPNEKFGISSKTQEYDSLSDVNVSKGRPDGSLRKRNVEDNEEGGKFSPLSRRISHEGNKLVSEASKVLSSSKVSQSVSANIKKEGGAASHSQTSYMGIRSSSRIRGKSSWSSSEVEDFHRFVYSLPRTNPEFGNEWLLHRLRALHFPPDFTENIKLQPDLLCQTKNFDILAAEKKKIKNELRLYDYYYERVFGTPPTRDNKLPLQSLYVYYGMLRNKLENFHISEGENSSILRAHDTVQLEPSETPIKSKMKTEKARNRNNVSGAIYDQAQTSEAALNLGTHEEEESITKISAVKNIAESLSDSGRGSGSQRFRKEGGKKKKRGTADSLHFDESRDSGWAEKSTGHSGADKRVANEVAKAMHTTHFRNIPDFEVDNRAERSKGVDSIEQHSTLKSTIGKSGYGIDMESGGDSSWYFTMANINGMSTSARKSASQQLGHISPIDIQEFTGEGTASSADSSSMLSAECKLSKLPPSTRANFGRSIPVSSIEKHYEKTEQCHSSKPKESIMSFLPPVNNVSSTNVEVEALSPVIIQGVKDANDMTTNYTDTAERRVYSSHSGEFEEKQALEKCAEVYKSSDMHASRTLVPQQIPSAGNSKLLAQLTPRPADDPFMRNESLEDGSACLSGATPSMSGLFRKDAFKDHIHSNPTEKLDFEVAIDPRKCDSNYIPKNIDIFPSDSSQQPALQKKGQSFPKDQSKKDVHSGDSLDYAASESNHLKGTTGISKRSFSERPRWCSGPSDTVKIGGIQLNDSSIHEKVHAFNFSDKPLVGVRKESSVLDSEQSTLRQEMRGTMRVGDHGLLSSSSLTQVDGSHLELVRHSSPKTQHEHANFAHKKSKYKGTAGELLPTTDNFKFDREAESCENVLERRSQVSSPLRLSMEVSHPSSRTYMPMQFYEATPMKSKSTLLYAGKYGNTPSGVTQGPSEEYNLAYQANLKLMHTDGGIYMDPKLSSDIEEHDARYEFSDEKIAYHSQRGGPSLYRLENQEHSVPPLQIADLAKGRFESHSRYRNVAADFSHPTAVESNSYSWNGSPMSENYDYSASIGIITPRSASQTHHQLVSSRQNAMKDPSFASNYAQSTRAYVVPSEPQGSFVSGNESHTMRRNITPGRAVTPTRQALLAGSNKLIERSSTPSKNNGRIHPSNSGRLKAVSESHSLIYPHSDSPLYLDSEPSPRNEHRSSIEVSSNSRTEKGFIHAQKDKSNSPVVKSDMATLAKLEQDKKRLKSLLNAFQREFQKKHERKVSLYKDIIPVEDIYRAYTELKYQCDRLKKQANGTDEKIEGKGGEA